MSALPSPAPATRLDWNEGFAALGPAFYTRVAPQPLPAVHPVAHSRGVARELGLDEEWLRSEEALAAFSGNAVLPGSQPLASVYSGHQFGHWAGQLGDGRALLLGELRGADGRPREVQLKGAGLTPYSRMGDGRAVLRSSVREFLCSEAMHGLGIPTTRALCLTGSDAPVRREEIETAAVVTRVAPSFVRFGHFEHFSWTGQQAELKALADFVIDRFYPECRDDTTLGPYAALLLAVSARTAALVAQWQAVGFCHGVLNTDNMSILGLTLDYGPFQFMDAFDPGHICNHSDPTGRYAYRRQPNIAYWNLFCLGQALLPLIGEQERALAALEPFKTEFPQELGSRMAAKLGLSQALPSDQAQVEALLQRLAQDRVDYTLFWRRLTQATRDGAGAAPVRDLFLDRDGFDQWMLSFSEHLKSTGRGQSADLMLKSNPAYVLRNHLGEIAIAAAKQKDFSEIERLLALLERPFDDHPGFEAYAGHPPEWASRIAISCSS